ncbi:hypothetical protein HJC23_009097 [Cyclotella cryptica]|uniref:Methyltransferase domain-containing protein n=1 Tax=Cyclotella cryptica TaxID=29204 RepID=A0ABD3QYC1_9STRA|eukprot:CCRYP_000712-RA/>CCRYP_000712-RA protein AED:0.00 eAED:0.00 QI:151/1/1/1/0/0/2/328/300
MTSLPSSPICKPATSSSNEPTTHRKCSACQEILPRDLFTKKENRKPPESPSTCQQCRRNQTAQRCKMPTKPNIQLGRRGDSGIKRRPNNFGYCNYLDQLFSMKCFPDIVALQVFTTAKDVSESMAALQAASQHGLRSKGGKRCRVKCLCIGDGSTPRTAALACFLKRWDCVSIDPTLKTEWQGEQPKSIRGLFGFSGTIEEFMMRSKEGNDNADYDHLILLCVHSHARLVGSASMANIMLKYKNIPTTTLVSLPCCPKFRSHRDLGREPDIEYEDDCVFSACRKVEVWNYPQPSPARWPA